MYWKRLRGKCHGNQCASYGEGLCDMMMKAVFSEDEPGMEVPDGDTPNVLKFPKVFFSLFWPFPCF